MLKNNIHILRVIILFLTVVPTVKGWAQTAAPSLADVDRMRDHGQFKEAIAALEKMKAARPNDGAILWRLSRTRVDIGEQQTDKKAKEGYFRPAVADGEAAVKAAPNDPEAHMALAIACGRLGLISPSKQKVELSKTVKAHLDKALQLNPRLAIAYHVRGRWYYEVSDLSFIERSVVKVAYGGLPTASFELAARDFQKAIELDDRVINHLELGRTYLKLGDKAKAKVELQKAINGAQKDPDDPTHKKEAQALLKKAS